MTIDWELQQSFKSEAVAFGSLKGKVSGAKELEVEFPANWYHQDMVYFVDCNGSAEGYYSGFAKKGIRLRNDSPDQGYDGTWGRLG